MVVRCGDRAGPGDDQGGFGGGAVRARRDVRADLARTVTAAGANLLHLARQGADLDAIYHRYFTGRPDDDLRDANR
jgi:hypothetical protein